MLILHKDILEYVSTMYQLEQVDLMRTGRSKTTAEAKKVASYLLKTVCDMSYVEIGRVLNIAHTTARSNKASCAEMLRVGNSRVTYVITNFIELNDVTYTERLNELTCTSESTKEEDVSYKDIASFLEKTYNLEKGAILNRLDTEYKLETDKVFCYLTTKLTEKTLREIGSLLSISYSTVCYNINSINDKLISGDGTIHYVVDQAFNHFLGCPDADKS